MEIHKIDNRKNRVAMIIDAWFPVHTGEQVYASALAKALSQEHGYAVDIFTRHLDGKLTEKQKSIENLDGVNVKKYGPKSRSWNIFAQIWFQIATFFTLVAAGKKYQIYHAHTATSAIPMKMASWITHVPTILTVHGNNVFDSTWTLRKIVHRIMFLETAYTQEISIAENFLKAKNVNDPVLTIPYGVDTDMFSKVIPQKTSSAFNVLFVGRLDYMKGVDVLLHAAKKVIESNGFIQSHRDFQLNLVGRGPDSKSFEALAEKLGIRKYVKFHGLLTGMDLIQLYKNSDLFVLLSRSEALPFSVLEACASGLPILATNVGDLKNLVVENVNGHLLEPGDVDEAAYYLEQFAGNPHLESMGAAGLDLVKQEYNWNTVVRKLLRVYESVIHAPSTASLQKDSCFIKPWRLPFALWKARVSRNKYTGKNILRFCFTLNLESDSPAAETPESDVFDSFLERFTEFCAQLEMPSTIFMRSDLVNDFPQELLVLRDGGHEIGVKLTEDEWSSGPARKKAIRGARESFEKIGMENVKMMRAPGEIIDDDLDYAHENGFEYLPVSDDPDPKIVWKFLLPFGKVVSMNLQTFLERTDEELLKSINRLRSLQKHYGLAPFIIFECSSKDFATGENFTGLSKKLAFLRGEMEILPMTLSEFCESCRL